MPRRSNKELEERFRAVGNILLQPPSTADELLPLLDQIEKLLSKVEQSPPKSMHTALSSVMKALMVEELTHHSNVDVKVGVASCISEITRITAPDAPYDDVKMKDVFQLIVFSFENLWDVFSRSYGKRTTILETMAKIRSCVIMLDLECDQMIVDMFQHFLKAIRLFHAEAIFTSMETIMVLVLEESEDISLDLLNPILATLKKNNGDVLPIAKKLAEKVVQNSRDKLRPYLRQAVKLLGDSLDDYSEVVSSICREKTGGVRHDSGNTFKDQQVAEDGTEKTNANDRGPTLDRSTKLIECNGISETEETVTHPNSSEMAHPSHQLNAKPVSNIVSNDSGAKKSADVEAKTEHTEAQPMSCNDRIPGDDVHFSATSIKPVEAARSLDEVKETDIHLSPSNIVSDDSGAKISADVEAKTEHTKAQPMSCNDRIPGDDVHIFATETKLVEVAGSLNEAKETDIHLSLSKSPENEDVNIASPTQSNSLHDDSQSKKDNTERRKEILVREEPVSVDTVSEKASDGEHTPEAKNQQPSGKNQADEPTKGKEFTDKGVSKNDEGSTDDSEATALDQTQNLGDDGDKIEDASSPGLIDAKKSGYVKPTTKGKILTNEGVSKDDEAITNDSEARPVNQAEKQGDASDEIEEAPSSDKIDGKKSGRAKPTTKGEALTDKGASKNDEGSTNVSEARQLIQTEKPVDANDRIEETSSSGMIDSKKSRYVKPTTKSNPLIDKSASNNDEGSANDSEAIPLYQAEKLGGACDETENASSLGKLVGKKSVLDKPTTKGKALTDKGASKNDQGSTHDSEARPLIQTEKPADAIDKIEDTSSSGKIDNKKSGHVKPTTKSKALIDKGASKNDQGSTNDLEAGPLNQAENLGDASDKTEDASSSGKTNGKIGGHAKTTTKSKPLMEKSASKNDEGSTNDSEARPLNQAEKLGDASDKTEDASSLEKIDGKKGGSVKATTEGKAVNSKSASNDHEARTNDYEATSLDQAEKLGDDSEKIANTSSSGKADGKKGGRGKPTTKGKVLTDKSASKIKEISTNDSEARALDQAEKLGDVSETIANTSSPGKADGKKSGRGKPSGKKLQKSPARENRDEDSEMSPKLPLKSMKDERIQVERTGSTKRKRTPGTDKASRTIEYGANLIGSKVRVWWPEDRMFYEGIVASFDSARKKHKVSYNDGEEEILFLKRERWEFVEDDLVSDEDEDDEQSSYEPSLDNKRKKKRNTNLGSFRKRRKVESSLKSGKLESDGEAESESDDDNTSKPGRKSKSPKQGAKFQAAYVKAKTPQSGKGQAKLRKRRR